MTADRAVTTWGAGDYPLMAERLAPVAMALVESAEVSDRDRVVDIACGTGNAALIAAGRGASVVGVDFEPALLSRGMARGLEAGRAINWVCADALAPDLPAGEFTVVISAFGVMYVPDHDAAAAQLARLCAPGARLSLAAWSPGSFMPAMGAALSSYLPPPPEGGMPPSRWGDESAVDDLLGAHGISVREATRAGVVMSFGNRAEAVRFLIGTAGHVVSERPRLERNGSWADLEDDLDRLVAERDEGGPAEVSLRLDYLLVSAEASHTRAEDSPVRRTARTISDEARLRAIIGSPSDLVVTKITDRLNELTRQFIERSPFVCVATALPDGGLDVSPRGDPAGFVRILDERTLLIPDRPGNRIADTLTNLLADPRIALLFLIPGVGDTFRVNGRAVIVDDTDVLALSAVDGKVPRLGIVVSVEEAYTQCSKALIRSELWNPRRHIKRSELPSSGEIFRRLNHPGFDAEQYDRERAQRYARREGLY